MSTRKAKIVVMMTLSGAALVVACGGGSAAVNDVGSPYDEQGGAVSGTPALSDRDPSPGRTAAPAGPVTTNPQDNSNGGTSGNTSGGTSGNTSGGTSGNTSGGTSGMISGCPQCDGMFTCDVTLTNMPTQKTTVSLVTQAGACTFSSQGSSVVFACGGTLTSMGQNVGTWANCTKASSPNPPAGDAG